MKIKFLFSLLLELTFTQPDFDEYPVIPDQLIPNGPSCNKSLANQFEFDGLDSPEELSLDMCPFVAKSCCTIADQNIMYSLWSL